MLIAFDTNGKRGVGAVYHNTIQMIIYFVESWLVTPTSSLLPRLPSGHQRLVLDFVLMVEVCILSLSTRFLE